MELFEKLSKEKQETVINAAFKCFGKNGYEKTSIADIAHEAGISKASVFQYFGTKKALYLFLFGFACEKIYTAMGPGSDDFFESIFIGSEIKLRVMDSFPGMFDFLSSVVVEENAEIIADLRSGFAEQAEAGKRILFANVDWTKFKPNISKEQIFNMTRWISDGYIHSTIGKKDGQTMRKELWSYLAILRSSFYKEEDLQ